MLPYITSLVWVSTRTLSPCEILNWYFIDKCNSIWINLSRICTLIYYYVMSSYMGEHSTPFSKKWCGIQPQITNEAWDGYLSFGKPSPELWSNVFLSRCQLMYLCIFTELGSVNTLRGCPWLHLHCPEFGVTPYILFSCELNIEEMAFSGGGMLVLLFFSFPSCFFEPLRSSSIRELVWLPMRTGCIFRMQLFKHTALINCFTAFSSLPVAGLVSQWYCLSGNRSGHASVGTKTCCLWQLAASESCAFAFVLYLGVLEIPIQMHGSSGYPQTRFRDSFSFCFTDAEITSAMQLWYDGNMQYCSMLSRGRITAKLELGRKLLVSNAFAIFAGNAQT